MRVEIGKIRLGVSSLTGTVYVYIPGANSKSATLCQHDVTPDFLHLIKVMGYRQMECIKDDGSKNKNDK